MEIAQFWRCIWTCSNALECEPLAELGRQPSRRVCRIDTQTDVKISAQTLILPLQDYNSLKSFIWLAGTNLVLNALSAVLTAKALTSQLRFFMVPLWLPSDSQTTKKQLKTREGRVLDLEWRDLPWLSSLAINS